MSTLVAISISALLILVQPAAASTSFLAASSQFEEPLIPASATSAREDEALFQAIQAYRKQPAGDDLRPFDAFLSDYPRSGWRVALLTNLGLSYYHYGHFSRAIDSWERAWQAGRFVTEPPAKALVDRAVGELARMHARLGHADRLESLLQEIGGRPVTGPATEALQGAREGLWLMRNEPGTAYLCGPMALKNLLLTQGVAFEQVEFLNAVRSGPRGVSLAEVSRLAEKTKLPYRLVFRDAGQPIPVPSVVHWKVTHFAALVEEADGRFHIKDPTFGHDLWITRAALESESSGYFLVPASQKLASWRDVGDAEASQVRGMGNTGMHNSEATRPGDDTSKCDEDDCGMSGYNIHEMLVSLNLHDTPVGYKPPRGPSVYTRLTYNQREANQPANFAWFNVSPKWTLNWLSYIQDDPGNARANALRYVAGGGSVTYTGFDATTNAYARETLDASLLVRTSTSPIAYERRLSNGAREVYSQSNGATTNPRRVFLTQIVDPAGNAITLNYDSQLRLTTLTDAVRRVTRFSYELASRPLLITTITDPFGRSAKIDYDSSGRLIQITDVLGMRSQFTYDAAGLVNAMTTPYGTTRFAYAEAPGTTTVGAFRSLEVTDPLGFKERVEFRHLAPGIPVKEPDALVPRVSSLMNDFLWYRNTFYWDKHNYPNFLSGAQPYTKARIKHWAHMITDVNVTSHVVESVKMPHENRVWFSYIGQRAGHYSGTLDKAGGVSRVLEDGTTQITGITYNSLGNVTRTVDPVRREAQLDYAANQIDLLRVRQKTTPLLFTTVAEFTYNSQHLPLTVKDAAGQTTTYVYNSAGQPTQVTNALGQITRYEYDSLSYLTRIVNPNNQTAVAFTYDAFGRVATRADSEGRVVSISYDALDRITKESYPDGTTRENTWDKLDLVATKDRQGRITRYTYDAVRNLVALTDPLGRKTTYTYYENSRLKSRTDPNGHTTTWDIDLQNRVTAKHFADGTQVSFTYEGATSRLKAFTDALGQTKKYSYTLDGNLAGLDYPDALNETPGVRFTYDPYFKRVVSMTDAAGTTQYQYHPGGVMGALQLLQEDGPSTNDTVAYQYDALGRVSGRTIDSSTETFAYDAIGRLASHGSALGVFDLGYLGQTGQVNGQHVRGGTLGTEWSYGTNANDRRLEAISNSGASRGYQYNITPENVIAQITETAPEGSPWPANTWKYSHDDADRLLQGASSSGAQYAYTYDSADNIMSHQLPGGAATASYGALNQVMDFNGQSFVYDANGNLTEDGERTYKWDAENRLIGIGSKADPGRTRTFRYDGLGRRIAIVSADGVETRYLWCRESLCQSRAADDTVAGRYYAEGEISAAGKLYYARDHLGSVRDVLSVEDGSRVASYDYDPYGNSERSDGSVSAGFRYAGMFYHQDSGLYLTQYRAYDARTGRWLSRDPVGERGGANLYGYTGASPMARVDRTGKFWWLAIPLVTGGVTLLHYTRNAWNENISFQDAQNSWNELSPDESIYHKMGPDGQCNRKFVSPDGHLEAVFDANGNPVLDPLNMGSYNYADPHWGWGIPHGVLDVAPFLIWGNSPQDLFTTDRFEVTGQLLLQKLEELGSYLNWAVHPSVDAATGVLIWAPR